MKRMIESTPLRNSNKKLTNRSARKTLVKKLRQNYIPKSETIVITGHNAEAGLDVFDSENEEKQRAIFNATGTVNKDPVHFQRSHSKPWVIWPNDEECNFQFYRPKMGFS